MERKRDTEAKTEMRETVEERHVESLRDTEKDRKVKTEANTEGQTERDRVWRVGKIPPSPTPSSFGASGRDGGLET